MSTSRTLGKCTGADLLLLEIDEQLKDRLRAVLRQRAAELELGLANRARKVCAQIEIQLAELEKEVA